MFNTSDISTLLKVIEDSHFEDVELRAGDLYIRVRTSPEEIDPDRSPAASDAKAVEPAIETADRSVEPSDDSELVEVCSPTVGTFYVAPSPGAEPFVRVGDHVSENQQVGLVEVMKLFNAVEAEVSGTVVAIQAKDAQLVEYGEVLMTIRPDKF